MVSHSLGQGLQAKSKPRGCLTVDIRYSLINSLSEPPGGGELITTRTLNKQVEGNMAPIGEAVGEPIGVLRLLGPWEVLSEKVLREVLWSPNG